MQAWNGEVFSPAAEWLNSYIQRAESIGKTDLKCEFPTQQQLHKSTIGCDLVFAKP